MTQRAQIEFHHRLSYPIASLCFALLAAPLALNSRQFSRAAGGVTGLLVTILYYGLLQLGDGLIQANVVSVGRGVWLPNTVIALLAIVLLWRNKLSQRGRAAGSRQQAPVRQARRRRLRFPRVQRHVLLRYVTRNYLQMLSLSFALLLTGYLLVDILERLEWFARYHADTLKALQFYCLRLPLLISRIVPMSLLLATTLTVSTLSARRELIGMRACGVSVVRAFTPILLIAGLAAPAYFLLNEMVVPKTNTLAEQFKNKEIKNRMENTSPLSHMIWYRAGSHVYQSEQLDSQLGQAKEISIYTLGADGLPVERIDAREAKHIGKGVWELVEPVRVEISDQGLSETPVATHIQLGEPPTEPVDTMQLGIQDLYRQIQVTEASGYKAAIYRVDFQVKLAAPFACLLLPAVALFFSVSGPPFPGTAMTLLVGTVLGVGHILLTGVAASLGYGEFLPPSLAGWAPSVGYAALAGFLAWRSKG